MVELKQCSIINWKKNISGSISVSPYQFVCPNHKSQLMNWFQICYVWGGGYTLYDNVCNFMIWFCYLILQGIYYQVGDIVSLVDHDLSVYYAQIRGFMQDQYNEKSAVISWLLPTQSSVSGKFDPTTYILGLYWFLSLFKLSTSNVTVYVVIVAVIWILLYLWQTSWWKIKTFEHLEVLYN